MIGPIQLVRRLIGRSAVPALPQPEPVTSAELTSGAVIQSPRLGPGYLYPDLLPENVWGSNLRGILTRAEWDRIRIPVCERAGNVCEVCGSPGFDPDSGRRRRPDCHELWSFEIHGDRFVQRLARLVALEVNCHRVQHIGLASVRGEIHLVRRQLTEVNQWSPDQVQAALDDAVEIYHRRANFEWDLDLSLLRGQIHLEEFPDLFIPKEARRSLGNSFYGR